MFDIMRTACIAIVSIAGMVACRGQRSAAEAARQAQSPRTVFTDSALHVAVCEPVKPGEDWRRVCVPKDQSVRRPEPKKP